MEQVPVEEAVEAAPVAEELAADGNEDGDDAVEGVLVMDEDDVTAAVNSLPDDSADVSPPPPPPQDGDDKAAAAAAVTSDDAAAPADEPVAEEEEAPVVLDGKAPPPTQGFAQAAFNDAQKRLEEASEEPAPEPAAPPAEEPASEPALEPEAAAPVEPEPAAEPEPTPAAAAVPAAAPAAAEEEEEEEEAPPESWEAATAAVMTDWATSHANAEAAAAAKAEAEAEVHKSGGGWIGGGALIEIGQPRWKSISLSFLSSAHPKWRFHNYSLAIYVFFLSLCDFQSHCFLNSQGRAGRLSRQPSAGGRPGRRRRRRARRSGVRGRQRGGQHGHGVRRPETGQCVCASVFTVGGVKQGRFSILEVVHSSLPSALKLWHVFSFPFVTFSWHFNIGSAVRVI